MESKVSDNRLTPEQQEEYVWRYETNLPYIVQQAHHFARKYNQYDKIDDFIQEGCVALVSAVRGFEPERGVPFLSYFMYWIHLRMKTFCMSNMYTIRVPERQIKKYEQYKRLKESGMTDAEAAIELKTKLKTLLAVVKSIQQAQTISFTDLSSDCFSRHDEGGGDAPDVLAFVELSPMYDSIDDVESVVEAKMTVEEYEKLFDACMDEFESAIIKRHFGFEGESISLNKLRHELPRAGKIVSRERLRQKKEKALEKVRMLMNLRKDHADKISRGSKDGNES